MQFNGTCLQSCENQPKLYRIADKLHCSPCHSECKEACFGPTATDCQECLHFQEGVHCVSECPISKYPSNRTCINCHDACDGCVGPKNTLGEDGCIACEKAIVIDNKIERCQRTDEICPNGFVYNRIDQCLRSNENCPGNFLF